MPLWRYLTSYVSYINLLSILLLTLTSPAVRGYVNCQNGGTPLEDGYMCSCTAHYHGKLCELAFVNFDPCANLSSVRVLHDRAAVHRFGNTRLECGTVATRNDCIDFTSIHADWYRLLSPAGNNLASQHPSTKYECGSGDPYILVDEVPELKASRILSRAVAVLYKQGFSPPYYNHLKRRYPIRILKCSPTVTLYFLRHTVSSDTHYCIGNKKPCGFGLTSIDGSGFEPCISISACRPQLQGSTSEPKLHLDYQREPDGKYTPIFNCLVFLAFNTINDDDVTYLIEYELMHKNGTTVSISQCRWLYNAKAWERDAKTFNCYSNSVLTKSYKWYGGSLVCRVQAKCTVWWHYNSVKIESNSIGLYFK